MPFLRLFLGSFFFPQMCADSDLLITHYSPLTTHYFLFPQMYADFFSVYFCLFLPASTYSSLTTHYSPLITHHSSLITHQGVTLEKRCVEITFPSAISCMRYSPGFKCSNSTNLEVGSDKIESMGVSTVCPKILMIFTVTCME